MQPELDDTALTYTREVGEAGDKYLRELVRSPDGTPLLGDVGLPATFRWSELFDRMVAAARSSQASA